MRLLPIAGILIVAWLLMIADVYLFFNVILVFAPPVSELGRLTGLALLKVGLTVGLGVLWFLVIQGLGELYTSSKVRNLTPKPSS